MTFSCTAHLWKGAWVHNSDLSIIIVLTWKDFTTKWQFADSWRLLWTWQEVSSLKSAELSSSCCEFWGGRVPSAENEGRQRKSYFQFPHQAKERRPLSSSLLSPRFSVWHIVCIFFNSRKSEFTRWFDYWLTFSISLQKWIELHSWFTFLKSLERLKCMREFVYFSKKSRKVKMYVRVLKRGGSKIAWPKITRWQRRNMRSMIIKKIGTRMNPDNIYWNLTFHETLTNSWNLRCLPFTWFCLH